MKKRDIAAYVQRAKDIYETDDVEIDAPEAPVSENEEGMWVAAWVWVSDAEMEVDNEES